MLPFVLEQWDFYVHKGRRHFDRREDRLKLLPSEYFRRQMYATFFNDPVGGHLLSWWGQDNCMWSNDFPHSNSTWPVSHDVIARDLSHLPRGARQGGPPHLRRALLAAAAVNGRPRTPTQASERQRASGSPRPAWPGNARERRRPDRRDLPPRGRPPDLWGHGWLGDRDRQGPRLDPWAHGAVLPAGACRRRHRRRLREG